MLDGGESQMSLTIAWGDCDPANIVFYPNYFVWFNEALGHHFLQAGLPKTELIERYNVVGFPMVETSAKFHSPSTHGDPVTIKTRITRFGRSSFDVEHRLHNNKNNVLGVEGFEKRVLVGRDENTGNITSVPIPDDVRALFEA